MKEEEDSQPRHYADYYDEDDGDDVSRAQLHSRECHSYGGRPRRILGLKARVQAPSSTSLVRFSSMCDVLNLE